MAYDYLDVSGGEGPLYLKLYRSLKTAMETGKLKHGERLPSIRRFCEDLGVSRTTVEAAYQQLCVEGYLKSEPKKGYFVRSGESHTLPEQHRPVPVPILLAAKYRYNLGTDCVDAENVDLTVWRRHVREALNRHESVVSYGDHQGEPELREALSRYAARTRGLSVTPGEVVVGAGSQPLLSLLCGLAGKKRVGIDERGFAQAEQIFRDFGMDIVPLPCDENGLDPAALHKSGVDLAYISPSSPVKSGSAMPTSRRFELIRWAQERDGVLVEDDYNGELRYRARPIPAMRGMAGGSRVAYLGSFSKLLLPSVRIGYMVLPPELLERYRMRARNYNQTASKIEQLALADYITSGQMERRLRRLRKLYATKSQAMGKCLSETFPDVSFVLEETALYFRMPVREEEASRLCGLAAEQGVRVRPRQDGKGLSLALSFSGIALSDIPEAVRLLGLAWNKKG